MASTKVLYAVRMPSDLKRMLDVEAKRSGAKTSQLVLDALWKYLEIDGGHETEFDPRVFSETPLSQPPAKMNDAMARFMATSAGIVSKAPFEEPMPDHTPYCRECDSSMAGKAIKGRGMVYACADVACPMYGMEQKPR